MSPHYFILNDHKFSALKAEAPDSLVSVVCGPAWVEEVDEGNNVHSQPHQIGREGSHRQLGVG